MFTGVFLNFVGNDEKRNTQTENLKYMLLAVIVDATLACCLMHIYCILLLHLCAFITLRERRMMMMIIFSRESHLVLCFTLSHSNLVLLDKHTTRFCAKMQNAHRMTQIGSFFLLRARRQKNLGRQRRRENEIL